MLNGLSRAVASVFKSGSKLSRRPRTRYRRHLGAESLEPRELLTYSFLGAASAAAPLPTGFDYQHVESSAVGNGHGAPYIVGQSISDPNKSALFIGTETAGGVDWSAPIWLPPVNINQANPYVSVEDLVRDPNGRPVLLGNSAFQATSWTLDAAGTGLVPTLYTNPQGTAVFSYLAGGDSAGNFTGAFGSGAAYNSGTTLARIDDSGVEGTDRYGNTIVGIGNDSSAFWTQNVNGSWTQHTPGLPTWSDGNTFNIGEISSNIMGGYVYNPDIDDILPTIWANDGTLISTFDLAGYQVSEIINDHGQNIALLNDPNLFGPSYIWAEGWANPRLIYGDLLPDLLPGINGTVVDISSGGSAWYLTRFSDGSGNTYYDVGSSDFGTTAVPEPSTWFLMLFGSAALVIFHRRKMATAV